MKERNYSIDVMRFVVSLLVVLCHTQIFYGINTNLYYVVSCFLPRFCVPYFFVVAGFYYIRSLLNGGNTFQKHLKAYLKVYIQWTILYYAISFVMNVVLGNEPIGQFLMERVLYFFTVGSYSHFWYFPALIYSMCIVTGVYHFGKEKGIRVLTVISVLFFMLGVLGTGYYEIGIQIPIFSEWITKYREVYAPMRDILFFGFPAYMSGYYIVKYEKKIRENPTKIYGRNLLLGGILYFVEIMVLIFVLHWVKYPEVILGSYYLPILLLMFLLKIPAPGLKQVSIYCRETSSFLYYIHPLLIVIYHKIADIFHYTWNTILFSIIVIATAIFIDQMIKCFKRIWNKYRFERNQSGK